VAEQRRLAALVAADIDDVRPPWLVDLWQDLDAAAGIAALESPT